MMYERDIENGMVVGAQREWDEQCMEEEQRHERMVQCVECDEPITDEKCWVWEDEPICNDCAKKNHRKYVNDLI